MIKPVILVILDGWGLAAAGPGNAVSLAKVPNFESLWAAYPHTQLQASGEAVGLPRGEAGNSESGHINLGAGQIIYQDLPRINMTIADGRFFQNPVLKASTEHALKYQSSFHIMGLVGAGGVHSSFDHLLALIRFAKDANLKKVFLHLFTDGRDSAPSSAVSFITKVEEELHQVGIGKIATICGRFLAMDRDHRWTRTQVAYEALTSGKGKYVNSATQAIKDSYAQGKTDEFIEPIIISKDGLIRNNDSVIFFNFRVDRPKQLTKAFVLPDFENLQPKKGIFDPYAERYGLHAYEIPGGTTTFTRKTVLKNLFFVTMTEYEKGLPVQVAFPPETVRLPVARILADANLRQLHLAESEKFPHVTIFFDGSREQPFPGEDWFEVPSPKVSTYDQKPEMSAPELTEELLKRLKSNIYDFVLVNFANADMVGHTGILEAGIKACEVVDDCLGKVVKTVLGLNGACLVTADHGNAEEMINLHTGEVDTKHSTNPVPLIIITPSIEQNIKVLTRGILADVAPTILGILGVEKSEFLTGKNLLL